MQRILLQSDKKETPTVQDLKQDLSSIRDILQTVVRQYHLKGEDKYDDIKNTAEESAIIAANAANQIESVKNETAVFEAKLKNYEKQREEVEILVNRAITKLNSFTVQLSEKMDGIDKDYKKLLNSFGGDFLEENQNIATIAIRLATVVKDVDKLKKKKFFGLF